MKDFWKKRWEEKDIPWHQAKVEGLLENHFPKSAKHVFVPLCGKSLDLLWLSEHATSVVGCDLSDIACREFFEDHNLPFIEESLSHCIQFKGHNLRLLAGDFFEIPLSVFTHIDLIYDRAALFALPPGPIRNAYSEKLIQIAIHSDAAAVEILLIGRELSPPLAEGPPFSISSGDIKALFGHYFKIEELETVERPPRADLPGLVKETAYRLRAHPKTGFLL